MSDTVDTRVVRMEFDNKQFEKNIKKTSQSLDNLKQNLDFRGVGDSLDEIKVKISALEVAATTFIVNLANRLTNLAVVMVKSLSVDNISLGWAKFGEKTTSVATMMAQKIRIAGKEITDLGLKTEVVNKQLELLTWFSDETSYSFTDMVNNVGKFTAAGQDLDVSVKAMEGIATWAALSGQNAQTASRAMYQLAQAMGKGKIQKIDWMSIQNANMDTEEFRETILSTAVAMGQLTKEGDKFVTKTGKKFTQAQFTDFLSEGWFTSDVLVKGLNKYSAAIDQIYEISERTGKTASEVIEEYGDELDAFGVKAFKAAQEARTFADVISSVKDAVSSKWMTTFESVFGGQEEAVKLWTGLANELYDVFAESGNFRNDILSVWKELGGRDDIFAKGGDNQGAFWNIYDAIIAVRDLIKSAWNTVFPLTTLEDYSSQVSEIGNKFKSITSRIKEFTERLKMSEATSSRLSKIFQGLFNILKFGINIVRAIRFIIDPLIDLGKQLITQVLDEISFYAGKITSVGSKFESVVVRIRDLVYDLIEVINPAGVLSNVFALIQKVFRLVADYKPITRLVGHIVSFITSLKETTNLKEDLGNFFDMIRSGIGLVSRLFVQVLSVLFKLFPIISKIMNVVFKVMGYVIGVGSKLIGLISRIGKVVFDFLQNNQLFEKIKNSVVEFFKAIWAFLKPLTEALIKFGAVVGRFFKNVLMTIPNILSGVTKAITSSGLIETVGKVLNGIIDVFKTFITTAGKVSGNAASGIGKAFKALFNGLLTFIKGLIPVLQVLMQALGKLLEIVGTLINKVANTILNVMTGKGVSKFLKVALMLAAIALIVTTIYNFTYLIKNTFAKINLVVESVMDVLDSLAMKLKSGILKDVANSVMKIALSLALLAGIEEDRMLTALAAMIIILGAIELMIRLMESSVKSINYESIKAYYKVTRTISTLVVSLILASVALRLLAKIPEADMYKALIAAIAIMSFMVLLATYALKNIPADAGDNVKKMLKNISGVVILALGLAVALRVLAGADWKSILASSVAIVGALGGMLGVLVLIKKMGAITEDTDKSIKKLMKIARGMIAVGVALRIVAGANWASILSAAFAISTVMYALTGVLFLMNKFADKKSVEIFTRFAIAMIPFGMAMKQMSKAVVILGNIEPGLVWNGFAAISAFTALMLIVSKAADVLSPGAFTLFSLSMMPFALAMETMAGVVATLALVKPELVWNGVAAVTVFTALMISISRLSSILGSFSMAIFSASMTAFGVAMEMMAAVIVTLAVLDYGKVWNGIAVVTVFTTLMVAISRLTSILGSIGLTVFSSSLIIFALAMETMAGVITTLSLLDYGKVWNGVAVIVVFTALMAGVSMLMNVMSAISLTIFSTSLMIFGAAMEVMAGVIATLSLLDYGKVWNGVAVISAFIAVVALAIKLIGIFSAMKLGVFAISLLKFAAAMSIMTANIVVLGQMPDEQATRGRQTIQSFIAVVALAIKLIGILSSLKLGVFATSLGMFGSAMMIMTGVIAILGQMDAGSLWKAIGAITALTAGLVILSTIVSATHSALSLVSLGIGMMVFANAMIPFTTALLMMGDIDLKQLGLGLLVLASSMLVLIAIAALAQPLITTIIALSAAMLIAGVGMLAFGIGLTVLATGLEAIALAFTANFESMRTIMVGLATLITDVLFESVKNLVDRLDELLPSIFNLVSTVLDNVINLLFAKGPDIIEVIVTLLDNLLKSIADHADSIFDSVFSIINTLLSKLLENIDTIADKLLKILLKLIDKVIEYTPQLVEKLITFLVVVTEALFKNIGRLIDVLADNLFDFLAKLIVALTRKIIALAGLIAKVVLILIAAAVKIVIASLGSLSQILLVFLSSLLMLLLNIFIGMNNVLYQVFKTVIYNVVNMIGKVVRDLGPMIIKVGKNLIMNIISGLLATLAELVKDVPLLNLIPFGDWAETMAGAADETFEESILSGQNVTDAIAETGKNITKVITQTSTAVQDAATVGIDAISDAVTTATADLGGALNQFGEDAGSNLMQGLEQGVDEDAAGELGEAIGDSLEEGFADSTETHSPSRVFIRLGEYLMQGLSLGITNSETETTNVMADVINKSLALANDIINDQADNDLTIKVGMDISNVEAQTSRIQDIMSGVNNPSISAAGINADYNSRALSRRGSSAVNPAGNTTTNNSNDVTYNNVFNITSTDPKESAEEIDKILQQQAFKKKLAHGV